MSELSVYAWAAFCEDGHPGPFIHEGAIRRTAAEVREEIGRVWGGEGEAAKKGWRLARRNGWRVIRVRVEPAFGHASRTRDE